MSIVDILIPSFNNPQYLLPCVQSIMAYTVTDLFHIYLVNNGLPGHMVPFRNNDHITILQQDRNVGWEGGLKAGLEASQSPYVLFMNDDTLVPCHQRMWLHKMLNHFVFSDCAAVGPTSNVVMGNQNVFLNLSPCVMKTKFLIGFCFLVKREDLMAVGGIDTTLPGGDDLDLSIRLRKRGKYLVIDRETFIWHYGFKTGTRVRSDWNSAEMIERTNHALIRKHGLKAFLDLWGQEPPFESTVPKKDAEGDVVRGLIRGSTIVEIGCGDQKTVPGAIGIDVIPRGEVIPGMGSRRVSIADRLGDVQEELPVERESVDTLIARHILEHIPNTVHALAQWRKSLKPGGRLVIAVPDHSFRNTIPMNYQHCHGFTPQSLKDLMESLGWETVDILNSRNQVSFVGCFSKNGVS